MKKRTDCELEKDFIDLLIPNEYISADECRDGVVYWVRARSIGEIAICTIEHYDADEPKIIFQGLRNKMGMDYLFTEMHYDSDSFFGTVRPLVELGQAPQFEDTNSKMSWLLEQEIETNQLRLEWLNYAPNRYKSLTGYTEITRDYRESQENLLRLLQEGFSSAGTWSFKSIMAASSAKKKHLAR